MVVDLPDLTAASNKNSVIRVLHVDDDVCMLEISKQIMMDMDSSLEFDSACCVDEAFKKLSTGQYDIVISDYEMPQKNGLQFLKELREQKNEIPFVLFTGKGREEIAIKALNLGADGYYTKQGSPATVYGELCHGTRMAVTRKTTEKALFEAQALTNSIINSTKDMIWAVSADNFRLLTFNKTLSDYFFKTQKLIVKEGMGIKEIMPNEQLAQKWIELNKRALKEGSFTIEYKTWKDPRVMELTFDLLKRGEETFGIAVFGKDITESKRAEEKIKESEEKFRKAFEILPYACYIGTLEEGIVVEVNDEFVNMFGYPRDECVGKTSLQLNLYANGPPDRQRMVAEIKSKGHFTNLKFEAKRKNGETFPTLFSGTIIEIQGKKFIFGILRDVAQEKKSEQNEGC
jgi:PAS domain S-box-containing protein